MANYEFSSTSLDDLKICKRKSFLGNCNLQQFNINSQRAKAESLAIKKVILAVLEDEKDFSETLIEEHLPDHLYYGEYQKKSVMQTINKFLYRFLTWENLEQKAFVAGTNYEKVEMTPDITVSTSFDIVLRDLTDGYIELIKFKRKEPELSSHGAAKIENRPTSSFELWSMYLAGKKLYPDDDIKVSFYHMKGKKDTSTSLMEYYNEKKEWNVISTTFTPRDEEYLRNILSTSVDQICLGVSKNVLRDKECEGCIYEDLCRLMHSDVGVETENVVEETRSVQTNIELTEEQLAVVNADNGIIRVNAAAGTGKTMVTIHRIVKLLKAGTKPEKILAITFTNKAAEELKERVGRLCEQEGLETDVDKLNVCTFNAFGDAIVNKNKKRLGLDNVHIASKIDIFNVIIDICKDHDFSCFMNDTKIDINNPTIQFMNKKGLIVFLSEFFNEIKVHGWQTVEECEAGDERGEYEILTHEQAELVFELYLEYVKEMKKRDLIEYQDQINYTMYLLENYVSLRRIYKFDHIMVDEYQDTDASQVRLLKMLLDNGFKSFMVVGDDAQAIYSFRLADQNNIIHFDEEFASYGPLTDINIRLNFRSTAEILNTANVLNEANEVRMENKELIGTKNGEIPLVYKNVSTPLESYNLVVQKINEFHNNGVAYGDIAIIARTQKELHSLATTLSETSIPYKMQIPEKVILQKEIIAIKCLSEAMADTESRFSFLSYLANVTDDLSEICELSPSALYQYIDNTFKLLSFPEDLEERLEFFFHICTEKFQYSDMAMEFLELLKERDFSNFMEMNAYLSEVFLFKDDTTIAVGDDNGNTVKLITAHTSKGKEWKNVIVLLDQFGNTTRNRRDAYIPEERRLLFVAITRARDVLNLIRSNSAKVYDFVEEIKDSVEIIE